MVMKPVRLACSQTLYFFFKVRRTRVIKNKNCEGFVDLSRALADVYEKNEKKNKTTSLYRIVRLCYMLFKTI